MHAADAVLGCRRGIVDHTYQMFGNHTITDVGIQSGVELEEAQHNEHRSSRTSVYLIWSLTEFL